MGWATLFCLALAGLHAPAFAQDGPTGVHVDAVRAVPLAQTAPVIGRLIATRAGDVAARVAAPIDSYLVEVGDTIERGQTLVLLDDAVLAAQRDQAEAALAQARAELSSRRENLALAEQGLARLQGLQGSSAFSQARFDDQRQAAAIARADLAAARAAIDRAQADFALARIQAERTEVTAPYSGTVVHRYLEAGAYAQSGQPLVRLVSDAALEVEADVPARRLAGLAPGARVTFVLGETAGDNRTRPARVRAILPEENPNTRTRTVRFVPDFTADDIGLASGQSVTVHVPIGQARDVLSVHKDAIVRQGDQAVVYLYNDGKAAVRPVQLGIEIGGRFEVVDGLEAGTLTVVRGNERLRPGQPLRIEKRLDAQSANSNADAPNDGS
ncbi:efflux RND transporter periplasmic adaptor subunit [Rhodovibrio salinarum]|uniref:efflux RND transporter periplasmic adaptor subunit n=1 Tax=Rhodovibrio salinarum TaxID=1087 RepID=UPI0004B7A2ED|nr:efflux RND transporter periplasmic adaptor subunit [Rhodovibrio salinarum]